MSGGPCIFKDNDTEPSPNPNSFNEFTNVLFIDQPIATGFSYGNNPINSSNVAGNYIWKFLQAFFAEFQEYEGRDFGIIGVSYGGHTGPSLGRIILTKNNAIENEDTNGIPINFTSLGLINAWVDPVIQMRKNIDFARFNPYRPLIDRLHPRILHDFEHDIRPALHSCRQTHNVTQCRYAEKRWNVIHDAIMFAAMDQYPHFDPQSMYDIRAGLNRNVTQAHNMLAYINDRGIQRRINAQHEWRQTGGGKKIRATGDCT